MERVLAALQGNQVSPESQASLVNLAMCESTKGLHVACSWPMSSPAWAVQVKNYMVQYGADAPLVGTGNTETRRIEATETFKIMKRCECTPVLDSSTLELYALCGPVEPVVRFIYAVLLRTIFSGYGLLSLFVSEYERRAGRSLRAAVLGKCVKVDIFREIVRNCKLGTATPEAPVAQWSAARKAAGKTDSIQLQKLVQLALVAPSTVG